MQIGEGPVQFCLKSELILEGNVSSHKPAYFYEFQCVVLTDKPSLLILPLAYVTRAAALWLLG